MGLKLLDVIVLIAYFVVIAAIGFIAQRLIRNREDYLMGGRRFGKAMMIMFAFGAGTHADNAVTVTRQSYKLGLSGIWFQWVMVFTMPIYWLLAPIFRRSRVLTTADFFQRRFGKEMMYVYSFYSLFVMLCFNAVMFYGSAKIVVALSGGSIGLQLAITLMAVISFAYGIFGGLIAAVWNDFFQGMLTIVMSILIIPFFWRHIGGLHGFQEAIAQSNHPNAQGVFHLVLSSELTVFWIVMASINSLLSMVAQPQILASAAAGKSEMDSRIGFVGGMILKRFMTVPWALTGLMAIAMFGFSKDVDMDQTFGLMSAKLLPVGCVGLMLACVMASVMDNCAVNMLSFSGIYTNSIHQRLINPAASERRLVFVSRIASLIFACVSLALSFVFENMEQATLFLWKTFPPMGIAWFFAILWRRANRWGAMASFFVALSSAVVCEFVLNWKDNASFPYAIGTNLGLGILAGVVVSLLTRPEARERTEQFFLLLKTPIGQEHVLEQAGFVKLPGNDTYELPVDAKAEPAEPSELREFDADEAIDSGGGGVATAVKVVPTRLKTAEALAMIDNKDTRRQSVAGFVALTALIALMLIGIKVLAAWLAP